MTASDSSSDRPVILIHGFGSSTDALWRKAGWIDALEAGGREVIGVDLPGHGARAGRSWLAIPPTTSRRTAASASTAACRTSTISRGS